MSKQEATNRPHMGSQDTQNGEVETDKKKWNCTIIFTVAIEIVILVIVCVLEYFLRFTSVFPIRKQNFSCLDPAISYSSTAASNSEYTFNIDIPESAIYALDFCIPVLVVLLGEVGVWAFVSDKQNSLKVCHSKFPQVLRRLVRFIGVFFFGIVSLMIYVDVIKLMTGRLAPHFLEVCIPNNTICTAQSNIGGDELCTQADSMKLRHARTSFPSIYSAMSTFSAIYVVIYIHGALKTRSVRIFRSFLALTFLMLAILCGLWEIGTYKCHWTDIITGYGIGAILAMYLCILTLNCFEEREKGGDDKLITFFQQLIKEQEEENANMRAYKNRNLQRQKNIYSSPKARWQRAVTSLQEARANDPEMYNTFQRDLSKGIDHYRDRRNTLIDTTQIA